MQRLAVYHQAARVWRFAVFWYSVQRNRD